MQESLPTSMAFLARDRGWQKRRYSSENQVPLIAVARSPEVVDATKTIPQSLPPTKKLPLLQPYHKILVVTAASLPLIPALFLLYCQICGITFQGIILQEAKSNRASVQFVTSIISLALATLNSWSYTALFAYSSQLQLAGRGSSAASMSIEEIDFASTLARLQLSFDLIKKWKQRWLNLALLIFSIGICAVHHSVWSGALTPVVGTKIVSIPQGYLVPRYENDPVSWSSPSLLWANNSRIWKFECPTTYHDEAGVFSPCAAATLSSRLLTSASQASISKNATSAVSRQKNDETGYRYLGRSYGVGSSAGLQTPSIAAEPDALAYTYVEYGYETAVSCILNDTSNWHLELIRPGNTTYGLPYIYYTLGKFPNGDWTDPNINDFFSVVGLQDDSTIVGLGAKAADGTHYAALAAGSEYSALNQTQCQFAYNPSAFNVSVNITAKTIIVNPMAAPSDNVSTFDSTGRLAETATRQMNSVGMTTTSLYMSLIGETLLANIDTVSGQISNYTAIADSMTSIIDDILVFVASYQIVINDTDAVQKVDVDAQIQVVRLGGKLYIYGVVVLCSLHLIFLIWEAARTKFWKGAPEFDLTSPKQLILASAMGGEQIRSATGLDENEKDGEDAETVKLRLHMAGGQPILSPSLDSRTEYP